MKYSRYITKAGLLWVNLPLLSMLKDVYFPTQQSNPSDSQ